MNGAEKGLQLLDQKPLISHLLARLSPQIEDIWLNINRSVEQYQQLYPELPYYQDSLPDFQGPLSGMLSGFEQIESDYLLFVPCDTRLFQPNYCTSYTRHYALIRLKLPMLTMATAHTQRLPWCIVRWRKI